MNNYHMTSAVDTKWFETPTWDLLEAGLPTADFEQMAGEKQETTILLDGQEIRINQHLASRSPLLRDSHVALHWNRSMGCSAGACTGATSNASDVCGAATWAGGSWLTMTGAAGFGCL